MSIQDQLSAYASGLTMFWPDRLWTNDGIIKRDEKGNPVNWRKEPVGIYVEEDFGRVARWIMNPRVRPTKEGEGAFCFAKLNGGRCIENVEYVTALAIDGDKTDQSVATIHKLLALSGYAHVVYSTFSSTFEVQRWRAAIPLSRHATREEHESYIKHVHGVLSDGGVHVDKSAIDPCRLWYIPTVKAGGHWEYYASAGRAFDVDAVLTTVRAIAAEEEAEALRRREEYVRLREEAKAKRAAEGKEEPDPRDLALAYLEKIDGAISGSGGHNTTFRAACFIVGNFDASEHLTLMRQYNERCVPPWSEAELKKKLKDAAKRNPKPLEPRL